MLKKNKGIVEEALMHPERLYPKPVDILKDKRLTRQEKLRVLENWEQDEEALCRAEAENMPKSGTEMPPDELLRRIHTVKSRLLAREEQR